MAPTALVLALATLALLTSSCGDDTDEDGAGGGAATGAGGGDGATGGAGGASSSSTGSGVVTTECGTYDLSLPGDSVIPDDPSDPGIVAACADYCAKVDGTCLGTEESCNDACRASACDVCPGTWDPYVLCLSEAFDAGDACSCGEDLPTCGDPPCGDTRDATTQCGG